MSDRLPIELALAIFRQAAELFVVSDHASAVSLAQTNRLVYTAVRPILLRRVTMTHANRRAITDLLNQVDSAVLILDLNLTAGGWDPSAFNNLINIRCLRGFSVPVNTAISGIPDSGRASLFKIQLWAMQLRSVPPSVTHVCLYFSSVDNLLHPSILKLVKSSPSLTHLGCEFVARSDLKGGVIPPRTLVMYLRAILRAGHPRLRQVAVRLCGHNVFTDTLWNTYLTALRAVEEEAPEGDWGQRVHLWRDTRCFSSSKDDVEASIADAMAGADVWSEARPLSTLI